MRSFLNKIKKFNIILKPLNQSEIKTCVYLLSLDGWMYMYRHLRSQNIFKPLSAKISVPDQSFFLWNAVLSS